MVLKLHFVADSIPPALTDSFVFSDGVPAIGRCSQKLLRGLPLSLADLLWNSGQFQPTQL